MSGELAAIFGLAIEAKEDAQDRPAEDHTPFLRNQGSPGTRDDIHDDHEARHEDSQRPDQFIMTDLIRTSHIRCLLRRITKEIATMQYATQQPKLPASTTQTSIFLPKNGAMIDKRPMSKSAWTGVLYLSCNLAKIRGIIYDSAIEYMARLPPIRKEFQLVMMPQRPPIMRTLAMIELPKATAMASAVTRPPTPFMATAISA